VPGTPDPVPVRAVQTLTVSPANTKRAPGAGSKARTVRSIVAAGADQSSTACAVSIFAA
jgi:hypothetical protein